MRRFYFSFAFIFFIRVGIISAADYYVSPEGNDTWNGSFSNPFRSIQKGVNVLNNGDRLFIREGRYHENVIIDGLLGSPETPIIITNYPGEKVLLDGTLAIEEISGDKWHQYKDNIYQIQLNQDIWQLITDNQVQTSARWPNSFWKDGSIWNQNFWACGGDNDYIDHKDDYGKMSCNPIESYLDLASSGIDVSGAMAILNIANFDTYCEKVISHTAGTDSFRFSYNESNTINHHPLINDDGTLVQIYNRFFFECKLNLLDAPTEWYYDKITKMLYTWLDDSGDPTGRDIRGKVQTYFFDIRDSRHVQIKGLDFFGTTFSLIDCQSMLIENCDILYPSYSKRMLGDCAAPECTRIWQNDKRQMSYDESNCTVRNCTFKYADGDGISLQGTGNVIENCLFYQIDYSCVDVASGGTQPQRPGNGGTIQAWHSPGITIRQVTINTAGEAHGICGGRYDENYPDAKNLFEYCYVTRSGLLHNQDGANFHLWQFNSDYTTLRYNWASDSYKYGYRYDGDHAEDGSRNDNCTLHHCVSWDRTKENILDAKGYHTRTANDFMIKGDTHQTYHNLSWESGSTSFYIRSVEDNGNQNSITINNAGQKISGARNNYSPFNGAQSNNYNEYLEGKSLKDMLRDPNNMDFRPKQGTALVDAGIEIDNVNQGFIGSAPDIGAYEFGDSIYWIPGYQAPQASVPIPANDGATNQEFVDLMWLEGYQSQSNDIYFGTSESAVESADRLSSEYYDYQENNIFHPETLKSGEHYYWRVDAVNSDSIIKGDVWHFMAERDANPEVFTADFKIYGSKYDSVFPLDHATVTMGDVSVQTGKDGIASVYLLKEGTYNLKIAREGFIQKTDSIHILRDTLLADTLDPAIYQVSIIIRDSIDGQPMSNVELDFSGLAYITDSTGLVQLDQVDFGRYSLSVLAKGYTSVNISNIEVYSDTLLEINMKRYMYDLEFNIFDKATGNPVYRALLKLHDNKFLTNHSGVAISPQLPEGKLFFQIEHADYFILEDSIVVSRDSSIAIFITSLEAEIRFIVSDSLGLLPGTKVIIRDIETITGIDGISRFIKQPARQEYQYSIEKTGYQKIYDSLYLETDTTIVVNMNSITGLSDKISQRMSIFPNPASHEVTVQFDDYKARIRLTTLSGNLLLEKVLFKNNNINIEWLTPGMYFLSIQTKNSSGCFRLIVL